MSDVDVERVIERALAEAAGVDLSWIQPPPEEGGWTLSPDALRFVTKVVELLRPGHVLELGSGLSTRLLSRAVGALGAGGMVSSVDHDPEFNWASGGEKREPGGAGVKFHLAPVVVREFGGKLVPVYLIKPELFASERAVDLVVIDGPPVNMGGREGTLYQVMDYARAGTLVLLDDSKRPEERAAIKAWEENLGEAISARQLPGFSKGMAAVTIHRPVRTTELWGHRFGLVKREIEGATPQGSVVMLAGETWWGEAAGLARAVTPFTEKDGAYWGEPADDAAAVAELDKLVARGATFIAFGWHAFWWLTHYRGLVAELERRGRRVLDNDRVVMFDLRGGK